ncbi:hypothetical protein MAR_010835 [Mya arenaria]|uniref:Zinc finger PHD-type domain-containing protein n=1 Tax=Mya arenaria TaxID=6604 RepID=A0ABY7FWM2_MYAAR|nr:hypothetical protein MAR_010835 [Mya arenaria]
MQCANCNKSFESKQSGFKRRYLINQDISTSAIKDILLNVDITPKSEKRSESRFVCNECEKLLKTASVGVKAKEKLFSKTDETSYIGLKRRRITLSASPIGTPYTPKRPRLSSTPKSKKREHLTTGARYFATYKYDKGFRHYMSKSKVALKSLRKVLRRKIRMDVKQMLKDVALPVKQSVSVSGFKDMNFAQMLTAFESHAPFLYDAIVSSLTTREKELKRGKGNVSLVPVIGTIMSMIAYQNKPKLASLLMKMNAVQMWRSGCKRSLFNIFNHMGICVGEWSMFATLDKLRASFDAELLSWKNDLKRHVFRTPDSPPANSPAVSQSDETEDDPSSFSTSSFSQLESEPEESSEWEDAMDDYDDDDVQSSERESEEPTILYGDDTVPKGYTLCWDNVGKQVKARHQTRNHGNKYKCWALAYAVKNRIQTTQFDNKKVEPAESIDIEKYLLNDKERHAVRERLVNMVQRILVGHLAAFRSVAHYPCTSFQHHFTRESSQKSEMFNIGVIDANPSSTAGVIEILDTLHNYVPQHEDQVHTLITWGDALSCERHLDAQNARANATTAVGKLQGLEPGAQEFHKRMLLMQDTMDKLFDGKSARDKGTLFHLKNVFNQRSVSKHVSETFNYVAEFLKFVTEGYVVLFAMDLLGIDDMEEDTIEDAEIALNRVSEEIVDSIWNEVTLENAGNIDEDIPMIECENSECKNGGWFHTDCCGLDEDDLPDEWFCSSDCRTFATQFCTCKSNQKGIMIECTNTDCKRGRWFHINCVGLKKGQLPAEDEPWFCSKFCSKTGKSERSFQAVDRKFEYSKYLMWSGLNDLIRRDAVRNNDGPMMIVYWKQDLLQFLQRNHPKYFILAHRLIAGVNGFLPPRLQQDLIWNRTVNIRGGHASNDEADLVNEFLNREFKESIRSVGPHTTPLTLQRHGKLAGGVGVVLDDVYKELLDAHKAAHHTQKGLNRRDDMQYFVQLLGPENLTRKISGRHHSAFPKFTSERSVSYTRLQERVTKLSKKLDRARRVAH